MDALSLDQYTTCPSGAGEALPTRNALPHAMARRPLAPRAAAPMRPGIGSVPGP